MCMTPIDELDQCMQEGYREVEKGHTAKGCDVWLRGWEILKGMVAPGMRRIADFDKVYEGRLEQYAYNWCQDLEMELANAGADDHSYHERRLHYAREYLELFPSAEPEVCVAFLRAQGEALLELGRIEEADAVFSALVERFPDNGWAHIARARSFWWGAPRKDYERAEVLLEQALSRPALHDRADVLECLANLYEDWGKPEKSKELADRIAKSKGAQGRARAGRGDDLSVSSDARLEPIRADRSKPGRNDLCWCGSGKKYKHCHMGGD